MATEGLVTDAARNFEDVYDRICRSNGGVSLRKQGSAPCIREWDFEIHLLLSRILIVTMLSLHRKRRISQRHVSAAEFGIGRIGKFQGIQRKGPFQRKAGLAHVALVG